MTTLTATQAKHSLLELLRAAEERGEAFQITRNGLPAGVLVSAEEWESLLETLSILSDPEAMSKVVRARREIAAGVVRTHHEVWSAHGLSPAVPPGSGKRHPRVARNRRTPASQRPRAARRKPPAR